MELAAVYGTLPGMTGALELPAATAEVAMSAREAADADVDADRASLTQGPCCMSYITSVGGRSCRSHSIVGGGGVACSSSDVYYSDSGSSYCDVMTGGGSADVSAMGSNVCSVADDDSDVHSDFDNSYLRWAEMSAATARHCWSH